jgi:hypothetical protein
MAAKVFISYRPGAETKLTRRVFDRLQQAFNTEQLVFGGRNSPEQLRRIIGQSAVIVVLIGGGRWVSQLDYPQDGVRFEIETALKQGKPVIPVLIGKARMPRANELPESIRPLTEYQGMQLNNNSDILRLIGTVQAITRRVSDGNTLVPEIPKQGYGPHFEIGDDGIITFAPPTALDRQGNNVDRLSKLHPTLRELSRALVEALGKGNVPHAYLLERAQAYDALIRKEIENIDFSLLYIAGLRLANAEKASSDDKELPSLNAQLRETVDSLLQLHGTFMLATVEGAEAIAAEERYRRDPREEKEYRSAAIDFAKSLQNQPKVMNPMAASTVLSAAEEIGRGSNLERSGAVATGIVKNTTIALSIAAALGALSAGAVATGSAPLAAVADAAALVAAEGLKKSKAFAALAAFVTRGIDKGAEGEIVKTLADLRERFKPQLGFFLSIETNVKRLAGQRGEFKWLTKTIPWLAHQTAVTNGGDRDQFDRPFTPAGVDETKLTDDAKPTRRKNNIYLAKVMSIERSREGAFVDYGGDAVGFLPFRQIHPDYYQISIAERREVIDAEDRARLATRLANEADIDAKASAQDDEILSHLSYQLTRYKIQDVIKPRQVMLVQVVADTPGNLPLTTRLSLSGRYLSLLPNTSGVSVSDGDVSEEDHSSLTDLVGKLKVPEGMGILIRATSIIPTKVEIRRDFERLLRTWEEVRDLTLKSTAPTLVYDANKVD